MNVLFLPKIGHKILMDVFSRTWPKSLEEALSRAGVLAVGKEGIELGSAGSRGRKGSSQ